MAERGRSSDRGRRASRPRSSRSRGGRGDPSNRALDSGPRSGQPPRFPTVVGGFNQQPYDPAHPNFGASTPASFNQQNDQFHTAHNAALNPTASPFQPNPIDNRAGNQTQVDQPRYPMNPYGLTPFPHGNYVTPSVPQPMRYPSGYQMPPPYPTPYYYQAAQQWNTPNLYPPQDQQAESLVIRPRIEDSMVHGNEGQEPRQDHEPDTKTDDPSFLEEDSIREDDVRYTNDEQADVSAAIEKQIQSENQVEQTVLEPQTTCTKFPLRDGQPRKIDKMVLTNHYRIQLDKSVQFYEYEIIGLPRQINRTILRQLFAEILQTVPWLVSNHQFYATDHIKTIIAWKDIHKHQNPDQGVGQEGTLYGPFDVNFGRPRNGAYSQCSIKVKFLRALDMQSLQSFSQNRQVPPQLWTSSPEVKALNIVISKCFNQDRVFQQDANRIFAKESTPLGGGKSLEMRHGYSYTIKPAKEGILLNVQLRTSAFYKTQSVSAFLNDKKTFLDEKKKHEALLGLRVEINYGRGQSKSEREDDWAYRAGRIKPIQSVGSVSIKDQTFRKKGDNGQWSDEGVLSYLRNTYNFSYDVKEQTLPAINLGSPGKKSWHSPKDLLIMPNQIYRKILPENLIDTLLNAACKNPEESRIQMEKELVSEENGFLQIQRTGKSAPLHSLTGFIDAKIDHNLLKIGSTTIPYPKPLYKNDNENPSRTEKSLDGAKWNLRDVQFLSTNLQDSGSWDPILLTFSQKGIHDRCFQPHGMLNQYRIELAKMLNKYRVRLVRADSINAVVLHNTHKSGLRLGLQKVRQSSEWRSRLVFLLLHKKDASIYQDFKDLADREFGLHSICITEMANIETKSEPGNTKEMLNRRNLTAYFANVVMKANLKFGGINHSTKAVQEEMGDTLLLGADVTHPGPSAIPYCPSIAALVGSVDESAGRFLGSMRLQSTEKTDREMIDQIEAMAEERIEAWSAEKKGTGTDRALPKRIIYYRDGVSEGQYGKVKEREVTAIRQAFINVARKKSLQQEVYITAVIATKRHHTRFFPIEKGDKDGKAKNCKPGTLVEDSVTSPHFTDFYLQSHSGLKGTARPTHYFVIQDDNKIGAEKLQNFTHELCYTYARATTGVSYAPPAYYADRLCDRGRAYIRKYIVGDRTIRNELNAQRRRWELVFMRMKEDMFSGQTNNHKMASKLAFDVVVRKRLQEKIRQWTWSKVKEEWCGSGQPNPWHKNLNDSMFWM